MGVGSLRPPPDTPGVETLADAHVDPNAATGFERPLYPGVILSTTARPIYFPGHTRHLG